MHESLRVNRVYLQLRCENKEGEHLVNLICLHMSAVGRRKLPDLQVTTDRIFNISVSILMTTVITLNLGDFNKNFTKFHKISNNDSAQHSYDSTSLFSSWCMLNFARLPHVIH